MTMKTIRLMLVLAAAGVASAEDAQRGSLGTVDHFGGYALGNLVPQGGWASVLGAAAAFQVVDVSGNRALRVTSNGGALPAAVARPIPSPDFGTLSADVRVAGFNGQWQFHTCGPGTLTACLPHGYFLHDELGTGIRLRSSDGQLRRWQLMPQLVPGTNTEFAVRTRALDGHTVFFLGGRPVLMGSDGDAAAGVSTQPFASFGVGTGHVGNATQSLTIDNVDDVLLVPADPPGSSDLMMMASFGALTLGQAPLQRLIVDVGASFDISTNYHGVGGNLSSGWIPTMEMSSLIGFTGSSNCIGDSVTDGPNRTWFGNTIFDAGQGNHFDYCHSHFIAPVIADDYGIDARLVADTGATADPFSANNLMQLRLVVMSNLPGDRCSGSGGSDCNAPIPDDEGNVGLSARIPVQGCAEVQSARVGVQIEHEAMQHLQVVLRPPTGAGDEVALFSQICPESYALDLVLDDAAEFPAGSKCPARGMAKPEQPLAELVGLPGDGDWELIVRDLNLGTEGRLHQWSLELNCSSVLFQNGFE